MNSKTLLIQLLPARVWVSHGIHMGREIGLDLQHQRKSPICVRYVCYIPHLTNLPPSAETRRPSADTCRPAANGCRPLSRYHPFSSIYCSPANSLLSADGRRSPSRGAAPQPMHAVIHLKSASLQLAYRYPLYLWYTVTCFLSTGRCHHTDRLCHSVLSR